MKITICSMCGGVADSCKMYKCRTCYNAYMAGYRKTNKERVKSIRRASRNAIYASNAYQRIKDAARRMVRTAIAKGSIRRLPCEKCGEEAQAHHDSYLQEDWLKVRWLCVEHHAQWHRDNKFM